MTTEYTEGPWAISKIGNDYDQYMVYSETENTNKNIVNGVEGKANAQLIASAPDMIETLKSLDREFDAAIERDDPIMKRLDLHHHRIKETIAKATGE